MIVMTRFDYAFQNYDATKHVRSSVREKDMSHKHAREVAVAIKGLSIERARDYLQSVINKQRAVAFGRYKNQVGHRSDPGMMSGRYPQKPGKIIESSDYSKETKEMILSKNSLDWLGLPHNFYEI